MTAHASCGRLVTPYENEMVIMHEGASGGGKSEMLQDIARDPEGRVLLSTNTVTGEGNLYYHERDLLDRAGVRRHGDLLPAAAEPFGQACARGR